MPIVSPILVNPLIDGRQSDAAMRVRRGVQRLLIEMGASVVPELALASGRRADLVALTRKGDIWIIEVKSSVEDFPRRPQMAGIPAAFGPLLLRHPSRRAGGDLSRGVRLHPVGRLWRRSLARGAGTPAGAGHPQGVDAADRAGGGQTG